MANILIYDTNTGKPIQYLESVHTPDYADLDGVLVNPVLPNHDLTKLVVEAGSIKEKTEAEVLKEEQDTMIANYGMYRAMEYPPIGDQLDALLKHLNYMQMSGKTNLVAELDTVIGKWLAVKSKYPKVGE